MCLSSLNSVILFAVFFFGAFLACLAFSVFLFVFYVFFGFFLVFSGVFEVKTDSPISRIDLHLGFRHFTQ